jgi:hypothetical protein
MALLIGCRQIAPASSDEKAHGCEEALLMLKPLNPCPVCGAETDLAEIEPHPLHVNFEIHGYLCDQCGPIKSLVVLRSWSPGLLH